MKIEYVKINEDNLKWFTSVWFDVSASIKNSSNALRYLNQKKTSFLSLEALYKKNNVRLDYFYFLRALKIDDQVVGFAFGIIRYFLKGVYLQIGEFGILSRFQKKGYGKIFVDKIQEELLELGINGIWCLVKKPDFWRKVGFSFDNEQFLYHLYGRKNDPEITYLMSLIDIPMPLDQFIRLFAKEYNLKADHRLNFIPEPE